MPDALPFLDDRTVPDTFWAGHPDRSRRIVERVVVEADLVLQEPVHFGSGDAAGAGDVTDLPLLVDAFDGKSPLLLGSTLKGALRAALRAREFGYRADLKREEERRSHTVALFGGVRGDDAGEQSPLVVDDARGTLPSRTSPERRAVEIRDGVRINAETKTAEDGALYTFEAWAAGTRFTARFELAVSDVPLEDGGDPEAARHRLMTALASALAPLETGEITLGAKKCRGYGRIQAETWRVHRFALTTPAGLLAWVESGGGGLKPEHEAGDWQDLLDTLGVENLLDDRREAFRVRACFAVSGSLLIGSASGDARSPDVETMSAQTPSGDVLPAVSGTTWAGPLRARARAILCTLGYVDGDAITLIDAVFGRDPDSEDEPLASKLHLRQSTAVGGTTDLVQTRIALDRFTAAPLPGALFDARPLFSDPTAEDDGAALVELDAVLVNPEEREVGLLLLLLKDLWTEDLALGADAAIGRGRLRGRTAALAWAGGENGPTRWTLHSPPDDPGAVTLEGKAERLDTCVNELARSTPDAS